MIHIVTLLRSAPFGEAALCLASYHNSKSKLDLLDVDYTFWFAVAHWQHGSWKNIPFRFQVKHSLVCLGLRLNEEQHTLWWYNLSLWFQLNSLQSLCVQFNPASGVPLNTPATYKQTIKKVKPQNISGLFMPEGMKEVQGLYITVYILGDFASTKAIYNHSFTHRRRSQPSRSAASSSRAVRLRCLAQGRLDTQLGGARDRTGNQPALSS